MLTFAGMAAPDSVLGPVLVALALGSVALIPSFIYLYMIFKKRTLWGPNG